MIKIKLYYNLMTTVPDTYDFNGSSVHLITILITKIELNTSANIPDIWNTA
jgi:hypothetical protein